MSKRERTDVLSKYLRDIRKYPVLSRKEERELAKKKDRGDKKAEEQLIQHNLRFVVMQAHKFRGYTNSGKIQLLDLIQAGNIGLMIAVRKFDHTKGYRVTTYARWWILSHMQRFIYPNHSLVSMGGTVAHRTLFHRLQEVRDIIGTKDPDEKQRLREELAKDYKNISVEDVIMVEKRVAWTDMSIDAPIKNKAETEDFTFSDILTYPDEGNDIDRTIELEHMRHLFFEASSCLTNLQKEVLRKRWFGKEKRTLESLAGDYGITRERVRQIEARALNRIRQKLGLKAMATEQELGSHGVTQEYANPVSGEKE